jgi:hypothetical protein
MLQGPVTIPKILSAWQSNLNRDIPNGDDRGPASDTHRRGVLSVDLQQMKGYGEPKLV